MCPRCETDGGGVPSLSLMVPRTAMYRGTAPRPELLAPCTPTLGTPGRGEHFPQPTFHWRGGERVSLGEGVPDGGQTLLVGVVREEGTEPQAGQALRMVWGVRGLGCFIHRRRECGIVKAGPPVWRAGGGRLALMHSTPVFSPLVTRFLPFMVTCGAGHKGTCVRPPRAALGCVCSPPASLISLAYRRRCSRPPAGVTRRGSAPA